MRRIIFSALVLSGVIANAQVSNERYGRVGINTTEPNASLEIRKHTGLPADKAQGLLLPKFSTAERSQFTNTVEGTLIYNTDKKCVEMYLGVVSGVYQWSCLPDTGSQSAQNVAIAPDGFTGDYVSGVTMSGNTVKFKLTNNSFSAISNVNFSDAVTIQNGTANITVNGSANNSVSLAGGASKVLVYTLTGTPEYGNLVAKFDKLGLTADQTKFVGKGNANIQNKDHVIVSFKHNSTVIQGYIDNSTNKVTVKIPYTAGRGSYDAVSITKATAPGEGGDVNNITMSIPAGAFSATGELTATFTVDGDGSYKVKQMAAGQKYDIAQFDINMNGSTATVKLIGIGGVTDRNYGDGKHDFIYIPIEVTGANGYKRTWLNNNLGADYSNVNSQYFSPTKQALSHDDWKAYGSLFQWQRPADGHELITRSDTDVLGNNGKSSVIYQLSNNTNWTAGHSNYIGNMSSPWSWVSANINNSTVNKGLWTSSGANNPCPYGYHVPTSFEWQELKNSVVVNSNYRDYWATQNPLKLSCAGYRTTNIYGGEINIQKGGIECFYQSSYYNSKAYNGSDYVENVIFLTTTSLNGSIYSMQTGSAGTIRCIKDN